MAERVFQRAQTKRARAGSDPVAARPPVVSGREAQDVLRAPGEPLSAPVGQEMQARLGGADFSAVRIHDGPAAAASARAVGASMYTSGTHIVVGDDHPGLGSPAGRRDIAHELYHVKQQAEGPVAGTPAGGGLIISDPADPYEQAAQRAADHIATAPRCTDGQAGGLEEKRSLRVASSPPPSPRYLQRKPPQPPLGAPQQQGRIELAQRPVIHCTMGQGVIADLTRYSLYSDQFSSCSPVVMYNQESHKAGLFHFGAGSLGEQEAELKDMYRQIGPTLVGLNPRSEFSMRTLRMEPAMGDFNTLVEFFVGEFKLSPGNIYEIKAQSNQYAVFLDAGNKLQIETSEPASAGRYDATNINKGGKLNAEVGLLVSEKTYTEFFATGAYEPGPAE